MPYKEFANGNPLPASDIDTYLMDQAVMTFANSTARSTAIPSPKEGMLTYLEDTNAYEGWTGSAWVNINDNSNAILKSTVTTAGDLIVGTGNAAVTRLGIGANGTVLSSNGTTAAWSTPSAPPTYQDWEILASGTITTGSTSFSLSGWSARDNLVLLINQISGTATNSQQVEFRLNGDNSNHFSFSAFQQWASTYNAAAYQGYTGEFLIANLSTNASSVVSGGIHIRGARGTGGSLKMCDLWGSGNASAGNSHASYIGKGYYNTSSAITSILIRLSGVGNNIDGGTYTLLGSD